MVLGSHKTTPCANTLDRHRSCAIGLVRCGRCNPSGPQDTVTPKLHDLTRASSSPFAIIWMFAAIVLSLLILANFSFGVLSSVRAYVGGESLWSKAQKDAVFHLQNYASNRSQDELTQFRADIAI